jgi:hypothetical protein
VEHWLAMRNMHDFGAVLHDGSWIVGCIVAAAAFCYFAPEYGYSPVLFFSVFLYFLSWVGRLAVRVFRRLRLRQG